PPPQCGAMTRLELLPITAARTVERKEDPQAKAVAVIPTCPEHFAWNGTGCVQQASDAAKEVCNPQSGSECLGRCTAGNRVSCDLAARYFYALKAGPGGAVVRDPTREPDNTQARLANEKGCELGSGAACMDLAGTVAATETFDSPKAQALLKRACDFESGAACTLLGHSAKPEQSVAYYNRACRFGETATCGSLARFAFTGERMPKDVSKGIAYLDAACAGGGALECVFAGEILWRLEDESALYKNVGLPRDDKRGQAYLERACALQDPMGCWRLGEGRRTGVGVSKDPQRAIEAFEQGCKSESTQRSAPCTALGDMLVRGEGASKDYARAAKAFEASGASEAQGHLAALYESGGPGLAADQSRARSLFASSCVQSLLGGRSVHSEPIATYCRKAEDGMKKNAGTEAQEFFLYLCTKGGGRRACSKYKAAVGTPAPTAVAAVKESCQERKLGTFCHAWQALGGKPTREELAFPDEPSKGVGAPPKPVGPTKPAPVKPTKK
ncbi:MAG TPA: tetratricopeptide repeat protein, partial [Labilithrix sp.]|nr:tetratricopeptide repeat protein [Labilithrix sp.]